MTTRAPHPHRLSFSAVGVGLLLLSGCASPQQDSASVHHASPTIKQTFRVMSDAEFSDLKKSLLFTPDDVRFLRLSHDVLEPNVDELLGVWYGFVGSNPHLLRYFSHPATQEPNKDYLESVRLRFKEWVLTTASADFDRAWLNKQLEIGLRHHRLKKNTTDDVQAVDHIPFRHLVALHYPITTTLRPFLGRGEHTQDEIDGMYEAWRKAVLLTTILWSQPYVVPQDY